MQKGHAFRCNHVINGTFAWFNATSQAKGADQSGAVTAAVNSAVKALGDLEFQPQITITPIFASKIEGELNSSQQSTYSAANIAMNLMSYKTNLTALTDDASITSENKYTGIAYGYYENGAVHYQKTQLGTDDIWIFYEVEVKLVDRTLNAVTYDAATIETLLAGKTYSLSVGRTDNSNDFAVFYKYGDGTVTKPASKSNATPAAAGASTLALKASAGVFSDEGDKYYFGMYVDGDSHNESHAASPAAATGNFTVTLTANNG